MIKSDAQLSSSESRLRSIEDELLDLRRRYTDNPPTYLIEQLERERNRLQQQIDEYHRLRGMSLTETIRVSSQQPVLLENIGDLLAKLRIAAGLTQRELAQRLGWEQSNLSRFESSNYSSQTIGKISEYLDGLGVWLLVFPSETRQMPRAAHTPIEFPATPASHQATGSIYGGVFAGFSKPLHQRASVRATLAQELFATTETSSSPKSEVLLDQA